MNYDSYGEVRNGSETYKDIAEELKGGDSVCIGWTDDDGTHFDILFVLTANAYGTFQGGIKPRQDLFVSIMRWGAFAFDPTETETHEGYYEEKLAGRGMGKECSVKIAELINGIKKHL